MQNKRSNLGERTLLILLGASEYPACNLYRSDTAFSASHQRILQYFTNPQGFGLKENAVLDLFDSDWSTSRITKEIVAFTEAQFKTVGRADRPLENTIVYYIGHGAVKRGVKDYYLAVRDTIDRDRYGSSLSMETLANNIRQDAAKCRRFFILDACFSGGAISGFQDFVVNFAREDAEATLQKELASGTALLCSSSRGGQSFFDKEIGTRFTTALCEVLGRRAAGRSTRWFTLEDLCSQVWDLLVKNYGEDAARPEFHCPDQERGNIATEVRLFPSLLQPKTTPGARKQNRTTKLWQQKQDNFQSLNFKTMTDMVKILRNLSAFGDEQLQMVQVSLLKAVRAITASYFEADGETLEINVNIMLPQSTASTEAAEFPDLHFSDPKRLLSSYEYILVTDLWAHETHCAPNRFALPVDDDPDDVLFGAPRTFITGKTEVFHSVQDDAELAMMTKFQPARVARRIMEYMHGRSTFKSFASIRLQDEGTPRGVLNIQSNQSDLFKRKGLFRNQIFEYTEPICAALASIVAERANKRQFTVQRQDGV